MSEQFQGKVEIQNNDGKTAIVLDGNVKPQVQEGRFVKVDDTLPKDHSEGDHFITGQLDIRDGNDNIVISIGFGQGKDGSRAGLLQLLDTLTGENNLRLSGHGSMAIGGAGLLTLLAEDEKCIELEAKDRMLILHGPRTLGPIKLDAGNGVFQLGHGLSKTSFKLDAGEGTFKIQGAEGETLVIPGMLRMVDGRLRLGSDPGGGGTDGGLRVRNAQGQERIHLDGSSGDVVLRNDQGQETLRLDGNKGDVILQNADCAEDFDVVDVTQADPGTVMILDGDGRLQPAQQAYDSRVAGVIAGAGDYKPGIVMDRQTDRNNRLPIALMGKVFCKADASYGEISVGDMLTTSPTMGHAMKAADPYRAFGTVIGKAMRPLAEGRGLIPLLVSLQ